LILEMAMANELLVSATDAETLALLIGSRPDAEADAADALAEILMEAPRVPHDRLPADRVAMNSRVTYREEPDGARRSVVLVNPASADVANGRISVLSPVGRSLLGRKAGSSASIGVPGGRALKIRVLAIEREAS
jgi:regulator of nucleoside diphosphate kinase